MTLQHWPPLGLKKRTDMFTVYLFANCATNAYLLCTTPETPLTIITAEFSEGCILEQEHVFSKHLNKELHQAEYRSE